LGLIALDNEIQESKREMDPPEAFVNISSLIIPFSIIFRKVHRPDIYSGEESIIFEERDSEFQQILIFEFL